MLELPQAYAATPVERHDEPIRADLELTRWLAHEEARRGRRPTTVFTRVVEHPGASILGNPYPRPVLLASLGVNDDERWQATLAERLAGPCPPVAHMADEPGEEVEALLEGVPAVRHRSGDAGFYLTSAITATQPLGRPDLNLGVYRVQIVDRRTALVFFDPRTHAHANLRTHLEAGQRMPVVMFLGGNPRAMIVAASSVAAGGDDWEVVARLSGAPVVLAGDPPAPVDAAYVIRGHVTAEERVEGPFAEFKGFYVEGRPAPVLRVEQVIRRPGRPAPTIATGRESGLSLTAFQNEYLAYAALVHAGHPVVQVRCPLDAFGEFLTLVETPQPCRAMVELVMARDPRTKVVICGPDLREPWRTLSTHGFETLCMPHHRKGRVEGERLGIVVTEPPTGRAVED